MDPNTICQFKPFLVFLGLPLSSKKKTSSQSLCQKAYFPAYDSNSYTKDEIKSQVNSVVATIDNCNSVYVGLSAPHITRLQRL